MSLAVWAGDVASVRLAFDRGADPMAEDAAHRTALDWAIAAHDRAMTELVLARTPHMPDDLGTRTALRTAAARDETWLVDALIARGVRPDDPRDQRASALLVAAANGSLAAMQHLVRAGASVTAADHAGDTPLAASVRAGCAPCVELALGHGAEVPHVDRDGRTALAWARLLDEPELAASLGSPEPAPIARLPAVSAAAAVARAIPLLQRANATWQADGECTACHHLPLAVRAIAIVQQRGFAVDGAAARAAIDAIRSDDDKFAALARQAFATPDGALRMSMFPAGDGAFGNAWYLAAELDAGLAAGPSQQVLATLVARMQRPDGSWRAGPLRGVVESSDLETTALAIHVIVGEGDAAARTAIPAAARWLARAQPTTVVDRVYALRAARDLGGDPHALVAALFATQRADGSWAHTDGPGDAYSTGLAVAALIEAGGIAASDPAIARAAAYLVRTQDADGSWLVPSRAVPLLPFGERGFPHGKHQFVSFAGTAWATIALAYTRR